MSSPTATLTVTFDFLADAQSFTANPGSGNSTLAWDGGNGNPVGCLSSTRSVKGATGDNNSWTRTLTYQTMGVPAGATVISITGASMQSRCTTFTSAGAGNTSGAVTLVDGGITVTLSAQRSIAATDGAFVSTNGTDRTGMGSSSSNSVTLTIPNHLQNANTTGSSVVLKQDQLTFTITYIPLPIGQTEPDWPNPIPPQQGAITNIDWSFQGNALYLGQGAPPADTTHILRDPLYTRIEPINPGAAIRATSENPSQPLTLKPLKPFVQADWPVPKGATGQAPSQHPNQLTGPLAGQDARLIGQAAINPNPLGATPSIDLRTHIQPLNLLAGQDSMVPGKSAIDPNPTSATPSIALRTHVQPLNVLAGQDAVAVGKAALDLNPRAPPQPVTFDSPNLLEATLRPIAPPPPVAPIDWPNPRAPATSIQGDPPNLLPTTLGPNAYILRAPQVTRYERASYYAALREPGSASLALLAPPVQPPPFVQTDWPNPAQQPARASFDAKTAQALTDTKPFAQSEWTTNPRALVPTATADPANLLEATLQPLATPPFLPPDWPNPTARSVAAVPFDPPNLLPTTLGPNTYILRGPQVTRYERANYDAALRESGSTSLAILAPVAPPSPFSPIDWPVPKGWVPLTRGVASPDLLNTTLAGQDARLAGQSAIAPNPTAPPKPVTFDSPNLLEATLRVGQGPAPFAQTDWPVPSGAIPVVTLRENIPQQTIYEPPQTFVFRGASQIKYELPRGWRTALDALSLGTNLELLGGPPPPPPTLPPNCYDWPNPIGPAYPTSLRTFADPLKLNLLGQDSMFGDPGQVPGYSSAQPRDAGDYQLEISTGSPLSLRVVVVAAPFGQTDWPNPLGARQPAISTSPNLLTEGLRDATAVGGAVFDLPPQARKSAVAVDPPNLLGLTLGILPAPFNQTDWPNPRGYDPRQAFAHNPSFVLVAPALKPFGQSEWPNPLPPRVGNQYLAHNTSFSLITAGVPPFSQNAWPNPVPPQRSNPDHVTQDLSAILPPPVVSADMPWSGFTSNMGRMMTRRG